MSEKKAFIFDSKWGSGAKSYWQTNIDKMIVFTAKNMSINKGSYIILKDGGEFKKIGIAKSNSQNASIAELNIFSNEDEAAEYNIDYYDNVMYVEIAEWINPNDTKLLRDLVYNSYSMQQLYDLDKQSENKKIFNNFLKENNLEELDLTNSNNNENDLLNKCQELVDSNYNLILTGAPGTGKTYLAKQIAAKIIFGEEKNINEMNDDEKAKFEYQYKFVQFHPSYDYTDFVEGIRPVTKENNNYGFERKDGTFKEFCKRAVYINIEYHKLVLSKLKEFCEYLLQETQNHTVDIENVKGIKGAPAPIKTVIYNKENETVKIIVDTKSGNNGISPTSLHKIVDWYQLYTTQFLELDKEQQNMKIFDNILGITYGGSHTYVYGFIKLFHDKYKDALQIPINYQVEKDDKTPFIFVIDEINRGDINKILGELFYAIDLGYRGEKGKVETQYQNLVESGDVFADGFYIPENVYIIGTMNDIDRSVESMDFAIRRRFAWQEVKPEDTADEILKDLEIDKNIANLNQKAIEILTKLNQCISGIDDKGNVIDKDALGEMYQIGASYFLKLDNYFDKHNENKVESFKNAYQKLWDNHLKGLIHEYVRGKKSGEEIFDKIQNKYFDLTGINHKENQEDTAE